MGDHKQESAPDGLDDLFEPMIGEFSEEAYEGLSTMSSTAVSSEKLALAEKRRRAEQRLEERRLREELGDYDLEFEDF